MERGKVATRGKGEPQDRGGKLVHAAFSPGDALKRSEQSISKKSWGKEEKGEGLAGKKGQTQRGPAWSRNHLKE